MSAEMNSFKWPSVGVAVDDPVLPSLLLLVEVAVLEVPNADRRRFPERELHLRLLVHVAVEVVDAERSTSFLVELFQVGAAARHYDKVPCSTSPARRRR